MSITFKDIENIIKALACGEVNAIGAKFEEEFREANHSLWLIREHLLLNDDFGISNKTRERLNKCNAPLCNEGAWCAKMPCKGVQETEKKDLKITMRELVALSLLLEKYKEVIGDDDNHHTIDRVMRRNGWGRSNG